MKRSLARLILTLACISVAALAFAQGGTTASLSGTVTDSGGGVVPGATVVVKNNATGVSQTTVTNSTGAFSVPGINAGTYTVTVSLSGFKTGVVKDVVLQAATQASVKVTLELGALTETVEVQGGTELVNTTSTAVSTTLSVDQIAKLPASTRNALNFITFLPGVETTTTNRGSTVMGLPQSTLSITIDGVNVQDNYLKTTDGFFARVTPRQDAVEQVTLSSATPGADAAGQGAVQIQFVTRSGTNQFKGTVYHFHRDAGLNTNYWFNERNGLGKNQVTLNQYGFSYGGPIVIPKVYDGRGKAFFFFNHEEFRQPTEASRTRTVISPAALAGNFVYGSGQTVNVLAVAQANGQVATYDPIVLNLLNQIDATTKNTPGSVMRPNTNINTNQFTYFSPAHQVEHQPTVSVDYNLTNNNRLKIVYNWEVVIRDPDFLNSAESRFPGFPNARYYASYRPQASGKIRSTLSQSLVNQAGFGIGWGPSYFGLGPDEKFESPAQFENQGGFSLGLSGGGAFPLTSATTETAPSARAAGNWNIDENLTWLKGKHSFSFGANFTQVSLWLNNQTLVPSVSFGVDTTNDPANAMFTTTNFPGAANADLNDARFLYALLTGRVTSINGTARLNGDTGQYVYLGPGVQRGRMNELGMFAQDQFRLSPTVTLNLGLRYEIQMPFYPRNSIYSAVDMAGACGISGQGAGPAGRYCNLFQPGIAPAGAVKPVFNNYTAGNKGYNTDLNNFAPNVGVAWLPNVKDGFMRTVLGDPAQATVRASFGRAYNRNGMADFTGVFSSNPGTSIGANRNSNNGNIVYAGESWPVFYREKNRLGPPPICGATVSASCMAASPAFPISGTSGQSVNLFDPNLQVSYSDSYSLGLQRSIGRDMAVEVRYTGTRNRDGWTDEDYNELNIYETHFLDEFKLAMSNLQSNIAAGRGNTFAYFGAGTNTSPLPIYLAYFNAQPMSQAGNAALYTGANWTNTTFVGRLAAYDPAPNSAASDLQGNAGRRTNALAAGVPANFFLLNPDASSVNITTGASYTKYDSLQIELRRRFSRGLQVSGNYVYAVRSGSTFDSLRFERYLLRSANVPHAIKMNWVYEVPVGRGKRFGSNMNAWIDGALGGWEFDGTGRFQVRDLSMSGVRLVGMTLDDLRKMYHVDIRNDAVTGLRTPYMLPDDVIQNTRRAFNVSATSATGYSTSLGAPEGRYIAPASYPGCVQDFPTDCGTVRQMFLRGPWFGRVDFTFRKTFKAGGKRTVQVQYDLLNAFNAINFNPVLNPGTGATIFQVTSAYQDLSNTFDPGGRLGQISWRFNW